MENGLKKRMYFLINYQLSGIQAGIQAGHCGQKYGRKYRDDEEYIDFIDNHVTWYVMNGGTTNDGSMIQKLDDGGTYRGSINVDLEKLENAGSKNYAFREPDLGDVITAVGFVCDERVFNTDVYPNFSFPNYKKWCERYGLMSDLDSSRTAYDGTRKKDYEMFVQKIGNEIAIKKEVLDNKRFF